MIALKTACVLLSACIGLAAYAGVDTGTPKKVADETAVKAAPPPEYVLGVGDEVNVWVGEVEELSGKLVVVDRSGCITLPLIGRVHAQGLTAAQLEEELRKQLSVYVHEPSVGVSFTQTKNESVSVIGAVARPGVYQLSGGRRLLDIVMAAGGLTSTAGPYAEIERPIRSGRLPVLGEQEDASGKNSFARINVRALTSLDRSGNNLELKPGDTISIREAQMVYVLGEVVKPGAFPVTNLQDTTALQVLALAGGPLKTSAPQQARVLRRNGLAKATLLSVNLNKVMKGKSEDFQLMPEDVLYVPDNKKKAIANRAVEAMITTGLLALTYGVIQ